MRTKYGLLALIGLLWLSLATVGSGDATAEVATGEAAPPVEGKEFFNTESLTYAELRGRLIFLELFATW